MLRLRPGNALPTAIFALVLLGAVAATSMHGVLREQQSSREVLSEVRALVNAQRSLSEALSTPSARLFALATGEEARLAGNATDSVTAVRLGDSVWMISATHRDLATGARRELTGLLESWRPRVALAAAIVVDGPIQVTDPARIVTDSIARCPADSARGERVIYGGAADAVRDAGLKRLLVRASPVPGGLLDLKALRRGLTRISGDARAVQGSGSGLLVVDGDLELGGYASWDGLIIVGGELIMSGQAAVRGGLAVLDADGDGRSSRVQGGVVVFSRCALESSFEASARIISLRERSWAEFVQP